MVLPRRSSQWTALLKHRSPRPMRSSLLSRTWQRSQRRGYASGGDHSTKQASSDLPWAAGAIAVTVPTCWYLLQPDPNKGHRHGHGEGHGDHEGEEEHEEAHDSTEDEPAEKDEEAHDSTEDEPAEKDDEAPADKEKTESTGNEGKDAEASDDSSSDEDKEQETPDTSDDDDDGPKNVPHETDSGGNVEGVQFKGASKAVKEDDGSFDTRKHIPDAKGGNKKRIESKYGHRLGLEEEGDDKTDKAAASKTPGDIVNSQSGKQAGLSNTDTKHSTDPAKDPEKSTKGEGAPETAKLQGSVDPFRPQR